MSVLRLNFHHGIRTESVVLPDTHRVVRRLKDGSEVVEYKQIDYVKLISQNGTVDLWSIKSMLDAGIDISRFKVNTTNPTRLETADSVKSMINEFDSGDPGEPGELAEPEEPGEPGEIGESAE